MRQVIQGTTLKWVTHCTKYHFQVATHGCCDVIHTHKHIKHDGNVISFVAISPKPKYQAN